MKLVLASMFRVLIVTTLVTGSIVSARQLETPIAAFQRLGIRACNLGMCIRKIEPGVTAWNATKATLGDTANMSSDGESITVDQGNFQTEFWLDRDGQTTDADVTPTASIPLFTLGDLINGYGIPCFVTITDDNAYFAYPEFTAGMTIPQDEAAMKQTVLKPYSTFNDLLFEGLPFCVFPPTFDSSKNIALTWCGFTTLGQAIQHCSWHYE